MISTPDGTVLRLIRERLQAVADPIYDEVGIGIGANAVEVARALRNRGRMYLFSPELEVRDLAHDLVALGFTNVCSDWGSPRNLYSGYHFELAHGFLRGELPAFDLASLDGGHVFHLDAPAACVLKELCKPRGHVVFDGWSWSLERSVGCNPRKRPATAAEYDSRQFAERHVQMVCRTVMDTDPRFRLLGLERGSAIYQRVGRGARPRSVCPSTMRALGGFLEDRPCARGHGAESSAGPPTRRAIAIERVPRARGRPLESSWTSATSPRRRSTRPSRTTAAGRCRTSAASTSGSRARSTEAAARSSTSAA